MMKTRAANAVKWAITFSIALFVVLGIWWTYEQQLMRRQIARGALQTATQSSALRAKLGLPLHMGPFISGRVIGGMDAGTADLKIPVSGPQGSGYLLDWSQNGFAGWHVCSLDLQTSDGQIIEIVPDAKSTCERE